MIRVSVVSFVVLCQLSQLIAISSLVSVFLCLFVCFLLVFVLGTEHVCFSIISLWDRKGGKEGWSSTFIPMLAVNKTFLFLFLLSYLGCCFYFPRRRWLSRCSSVHRKSRKNNRPFNGSHKAADTATPFNHITARFLGEIKSHRTDLRGNEGAMASREQDPSLPGFTTPVFTVQANNSSLNHISRVRYNQSNSCKLGRLWTWRW